MVDETRVGVDAKLKQWRQQLESRGCRISWSKTECTECCFSTRRESGGDEVTLDGKEYPNGECFKYLGSILQKN